MTKIKKNRKEEIFEFLYEFRNENHFFGTTKKLFFKYLSCCDDHLINIMFEAKLKYVLENKKELLSHEYFKNK